MSKSDDNTNELESYGVWVKNSTGNDATETPADTSDELNFDDGGLDLPDFDDSDFSDMFKEEPQGADAGALDDFGSEDDTTLSTDELANITDGFEVEQVDAPADNEDLDLGDFSLPEETEAAPDASEEVSEESSEDISFDLDEPETQTEEVSFDEEAPASEEEVSEDFSSGEDEEISLDDFMDGGFSDESVAAGNNGYEPGAEPSAAPVAASDTEELSLDDFMDGDSFDSAPAAKEDETVVDEAPLDMDISFDDSADSVQTEDNVSLDISSDDDDLDDDTEETPAVETEEVSMDDFGSSFTAEETSAPAAPSEENINTEDVDLSDFGIDANAEETPIVQDVEEAKNKEKIVDYDLSVGDESTATAPVVNEIKTDAAEETVEEAAPVAEAQPAAAPVDNSLLQQIVSELSSLKDEMNSLKANLAEIKTHENTVSPAAAAVAAGAAGIVAGAAAASIADIDDEIPAETEQDSGGFFSEDDGDDTIALSFDELDNIMNTAEFGDTVEADENASEEEAPAEETSEPAVEEEIVTEEEPVIEETAIEEIPNEEPIEDITASDDTVIDESIISSEPEEEDEDFESASTEIENAVSEESDSSLDDINFDEEQSESFDFSDEKLEEPEIDEFIPDGNDELYENEELPDEISIPKEDDLLVESNSSDFMDSVKETTEAEEAPAEFVADDTTEADTLDLPDELPDEISNTTEEPAVDDDIPTVDKLLGDEEEPAVEETSVEETEVEAPVEEAPAAASFAEVDNLDNTLSESNLAYLDKQSTENTADAMANADLKQDIKSVLLYMDQLLENLPEDKIVEFAKSDEFVTYKKLFSELGLS